MNKRIGVFGGLTALLAMGAANAQVACPEIAVGTAINDETGHTFFIYAAPGITWDQAQACVADLPQQGNVPAHLATITSSSENAWIVSELLGPALDGDGLASSQVWIGGFQEEGAAEPGEGWRWVNNEGRIPVPGTSVTLGYGNWSADPLEPNNTGGVDVNERHLTLGRYDDLGLWNDEGAAPSNIGGFVVEYDTPRAAGGGCTTDGTTTCETIKGQTLTFPPGTVIGTDNGFTFTAFEFTDPRVDPNTGRCDVTRGPLTLFEGDEFNVPGPNSTSVSGKLVIPAYLCGSPKFIVVRALPFGAGIDIPKGVVVTESNTRTIPDPSNPDVPLPGILPGNFFDCKSPIPAGLSPQQQDVGVWQSLDGTEMWESATLPTSSFARFAGTAAELTTDCGSTLIKTRTKSNFVVGLHLDFGADVLPGTPAEYNEMRALTQYKISLVRRSVVDARAKGRISRLDALVMLAKLDAAAVALANDYPILASKAIELFLLKVNTSRYSTPLVPGFNYNGDHLSRGENILFTLNHKVIPFKPVSAP